MSWTNPVGHNAILDRLRAAVRRKRLGHAFLFVGPNGVGKRRIARHVAQGLLCETRDPELLDPCRRCDSCVQVEAGSHPDLVEVAKEEDDHVFGIDLLRTSKEARHQQDRRGLIETLGVKPARGSYKIAILDDVDLFSDQAANCLLKTLEEPPPMSLLFLLSASAEKQLPTIVSRAQMLAFRELCEEEVALVLIELGVASDPAEAQRLARLSGGSVADACAAAQSDWRPIRERLHAALAEPDIPVVALTRELQQFVDDAGKDNAAKRERARLLIRIAADYYRECLRHRSGDTFRSTVENAWPFTIAARLDEETILNLLERCFDADFHVERKLHLALALDCWIDDLSQITAGRYVPPIR